MAPMRTADDAAAGDRVAFDDDGLHHDLHVGKRGAVSLEEREEVFLPFQLGAVHVPQPVDWRPDKARPHGCELTIQLEERSVQPCPSSTSRSTSARVTNVASPAFATNEFTT
jgi:hypothetical protein